MTSENRHTIFVKDLLWDEIEKQLTGEGQYVDNMSQLVTTLLKKLRDGDIEIVGEDLKR